MNSYANFGFPQLISEVRPTQTYTSNRSGELTYLGESFNYISLVTHVHSSALFFPEVSPRSPRFSANICRATIRNG